MEVIPVWEGIAIQPAEAVQIKPDRLIGIDVARGLAIVLMVFSHGLHWLYTGTSHDLIKLYGSLSLGDAATAVFFTVAGLSLYTSITAQLKKGAGPESLLHRYRKRFGQLYFIGFCISLFWSVLQAQALVLFCLASLYLCFLPRWGSGRSRLIILGAVIASLSVHQLAVSVLDYSPFLIFLRGQFPFFAVLGMGGAGFLSSVLLDFRRRNLILIFSGGALIAAAHWLYSQGYPLHRFDVSPPFMVFGFGLTLFCVGLFNYAEVQKLFIFRWLACVGKDALFLFVFHYAAFFLPLHLLGLDSRLGPLPALVVSGFFVAAVVYTAHRRRQSSFTMYQLADAIFAVACRAAVALQAARRSFASLAVSPAKKNPTAQH